LTQNLGLDTYKKSRKSCHFQIVDLDNRDKKIFFNFDSIHTTIFKPGGLDKNLDASKSSSKSLDFKNLDRDKKNLVSTVMIISTSFKS
jgi:hypothetical protein